MFPLHQSNELCFQISTNPQQKQAISSEDLILGHDINGASLEDNQNNNGFDANRIESWNLLLPNNNPQSSNEKNKKKMNHREIERQRRQEMASLHASLRSLLPLQLIKGKRSISDHINESARYIKHLQGKIKELGSMRDELKLKLSGSDTNTAAPTEHGRRESSDCYSTPVQLAGRLTVQPYCTGGVEIVFSTTGCSEEGNIGNLPLSRVLEVLLREGLSIVTCVSTRVNGLLLHTIQSEASEQECIDISALEQKLKEVFFHSSNHV